MVTDDNSAMIKKHLIVSFVFEFECAGWKIDCWQFENAVWNAVVHRVKDFHFSPDF